MAADPAPADSAPVVALARLGRRQGSRWTLKGVDLQVPKGQLLMVVGNNGSGKTTLLRLIAQAWLPSAGKLQLFGAAPGPEAAARTALLSHADYLYDDLSAWENLSILVRMFPKKDTDPLAILAEVGLDKRRDDLVRTFSAGMRKRLALARLLWKAPDLVLLDEPYGQLDPAGGQMMDALFRRFRAAGTTLIVATHQVRRVGGLCDRAIHLVDGTLAWEGAAADAAAVADPGGEE